VTDAAIIGAGELGGSIAHVLARRDIVRRIELIDPAAQIAAGKALDIVQAAPVEGFCTMLRGATDVSRLAGASIVILADFARPDSAPDPLLALKHAAALAPRAVIVCAGSGHRELVERAPRELQVRREKIVGSAPEALAASVRAIVAVAVDGSAQDVSLTLVGIPPGQAVVPWDDVTIAGAPATRVISDPVRRRLAAQIGPLWPPGPHALAHAAADTISAIRGTRRRAICCFVAPDDSNGRRARAVALPVRLGPGGVTRVESLTLSVAAQIVLDGAALL
jgi:malate dehydrogenase